MQPISFTYAGTECVIYSTSFFFSSFIQILVNIPQIYMVSEYLSKNLQTYECVC